MTDEKKKRIEELRKEIKEEGKLMAEASRFPIKPPRSQKFIELLKLRWEDEEDEDEELDEETQE